ncbi:MAG: helix-turn-helix domain-containing protein [Clostridia bacterium]|nr:helix-turn-helix domain-containing protein [Clostridia bacterium]
MEIAKVHRYLRVERKTFIKEHFCSRRNSVYLIEKGDFEYTINGQTYQAAESDCVFYKKGSYYDRTVLTPVVLHIFDIDFDFIDSDAPISFFHSDRIRSDIALLNSVNADIEKNMPYIEHLLNDILHIYYSEKAAPKNHSSINDQRIVQALDIIRDRFDKGIAVSDVAKAVHLSYPQFVRLFEKNMHVTPIRYINELKLDKAKALLYTTDLPIKVIASECGFDDIYYFSNFFKTMSGVSPTAYRRT